MLVVNGIPGECYNVHSFFAGMAAMTEPACKHERTRLIAQDKDSRYVECIDCGEIFEAEELKAVEPNAREPKTGPGFDESLSDA